MTLTRFPPIWYCAFWLLMLVGWYFATRSAVLSALREHARDSITATTGS